MLKKYHLIVNLLLMSFEQVMIFIFLSLGASMILKMKFRLKKLLYLG